VVPARALRTRANPAVHLMVPVHRTMQRVPAVPRRAHLLMEPDLMVPARALRMLVIVAAHRMDPVLRMTRRVPAVRTRVHLLMEQDLMAPARALRTRVDPAVHRMDLVPRTMQRVPAVHPKRLLMKASQGDGAGKTKTSPRKEKIVNSLPRLGRCPVFFRDF
jgi:hypothetical protein